jgi:predicted small lipoprotein YifL
MKANLLILSVALTISACGREGPAPVATSASQPSEQSSEPANPDFVGKVWISTTPGKPLGSMLIFMPDRTLVMDSCFETYRLSKWGVAGERIRWLEDSSIPIEASVDMPRPNQLILRVAGQDQDQSFTTASVPYVCPDMPR